MAGEDTGMDTGEATGDDGERARLARVLDGPDEEAALDAARRLFQSSGLPVRSAPEVWGLLARRLTRAEPGTELCEWLLETLEEPRAVPFVLGVLEDTRGAERLGLLEVLARSGVRDERIYGALIGLLREEPFLGALLLRPYGDARAVGALGEVLDAYTLEEDVADVFAQQTVLELARALEGLGGGLEGARWEKLLVARRLRDAWNRTFDAWQRRVEGARRNAPGRNEPCWCGSGVKYKRCHLGEDRAPRM